jgi:hypothetical protein
VDPVAELIYRGAPAAGTTDIGTRGYVAQVMESGMTAEEIDEHIEAGLAGYAKKTYADSRDVFNATQSYADAGDATRLKLSQKNVVNGIPGLDAGGRVSQSQIDAPITQRWPRGLWTPSSYGSPVTVSGTTESTLFPIDVTDPGFAYRLVVMGQVDGLSTASGAAPQVLVRVGSTSGQIIASGIGTAEAYDYFGADIFSQRSAAANLGSGWEETYAGLGSGHAAIVNLGASGISASYVKNGNSATRNGVFRRLGDDATTISDYQEVSYTCGTSCEAGITASVPGRNRMFGRMSADRQNYVAFQVDNNSADLFFGVSGLETTSKASAACSQLAGDVLTGRFGTSSGVRWYQLLRNGASIINFNDSANASVVGSGERGWGFGFQAGQASATVQAAPAALDQILIRDNAPGVDISSYAPVTVLPVSVASQTVKTGATTLYVRVSRTGSAGTVGAGYSHTPSLSVLAVPA